MTCMLVQSRMFIATVHLYHTGITCMHMIHTYVAVIGVYFLCLQSSEISYIVNF